MKVIVSEALVDRRQVRFPRSKKKRIRNKWAKQERNWRAFPKPGAIRVGDTLLMHPVEYERLHREMMVYGNSTIRASLPPGLSPAFLSLF